MNFKRLILMLAWLGGVAFASGQVGRNDPRVGYVYPAGACRNTTVEILAGGQNLKAVDGVRVSGDGVEARIIKTYPPLRMLEAEQRELMKWKIECRRAQLNGTPVPPKPPGPKPNADGTPAPEVKLPDNPLLDLLETLDMRQIMNWVTVFRRYNKMQPNPQLGELVRIEVKVAANAEPGTRMLRLNGPLGLTNPLRFEVGTLPEIRECEPNEPQADGKLPDGPAAELPCTFNGQIQSGDVDTFRFHARRGQNLVVRGRARGLIPYLADAVPGWFQMVIVVRDAKGRELAYGDHYQFDQDPVFRCGIPEDGDYALEVRDSLYRGREDFVYRISVGELPFVTSVFPLGGRQGEPLVAAVRGWNLPADKLALDTSAGGPPLRMTRLPGKLAPSNGVYYAVDSLPEVNEVEPNDDIAHAKAVPFPCVINGRIDKAGDVDVFRIEGRKGHELVAEVLARRLRSPLDSVVYVMDGAGKVLGWNDDFMEKDGQLYLGEGLITHHADSRVRVKLSKDGPVYVKIADAQMHGGPEYAYRLRLSEVWPDFELRVTPSVLNVPQGAHVPLRVHVLRNDGFTGDIRLALEDAPPGFRLSGARIPAGVSQVRATLTIPALAAGGVFSPRLTGTAGEEGQTVTRTAVAADDMMQAFLWRHLVPAGEWLVCVATGRGKRPSMELDSPLPLQVPVGGSAEIRVKVPKWITDRGVELEPSEAPPGISVSPVKPVDGGVAFDVKADRTAKAGMETNLIVDIFSKGQATNKPGAPPAAKVQQRYMLAGLPAIPIILTKPAKP